MFYLTCTMISGVDLACYGVSRAKDWVSVDCSTSSCYDKESTGDIPVVEKVKNKSK